MSWQRPNGLIVLALAGILTPASFVAAATVITDISFSAANSGPVNPVTGSFRFAFDDSLLDMMENGTVGSLGTPLLPTLVDVNFDSFTTANVGAILNFTAGQLTDFSVGGTNGSNICNVLADDTDDFQLTVSAGEAICLIVPGDQRLRYTTATNASGLSIGEDLTVQSETRVSGS